MRGYLFGEFNNECFNNSMRLRENVILGRLRILKRWNVDDKGVSKFSRKRGRAHPMMVSGGGGGAQGKTNLWGVKMGIF